MRLICWGVSFGHSRKRFYRLFPMCLSPWLPVSTAKPAAGSCPFCIAQKAFGVQLLQPYFQHWLQLPHVGEVELLGLEAADGRLAKHLSKKSVHGKPHFGLQVPKGHPPLSQLLGQLLPQEALQDDVGSTEGAFRRGSRTRPPSLQFWPGTHKAPSHLDPWPDHQAARGHLGAQPNRSVNAYWHWLSGPTPITYWLRGLIWGLCPTAV